MIGTVSAAHLRGSRHSSVFRGGFTVLTLAPIVVFIGVGFTRGGGQPIGFVPGAQDVTQIVSAGFAVMRLMFARCERLPVAGSRDRAEELAGIPLRECPL